MAITREADAFICTAYKKYLEKRKSGMPREDAFNINPDDIISDLEQKWLKADIDSACLELDGLGFLTCIFGDNTIYSAKFTYEGIAYMENRFGNNLKKVLDFIKDIKDLIPFI